MADAAVKVYTSVFYGGEDGFVSHYACAGEFGCFGVGAFWGTDDGYAQVGFHGVRELHAVADDLAGFRGAEAEVEFVFGGGWGVAYFCCSQIPFRLLLAAWREEEIGEVRMVYRIASTKLNCNAFFKSGNR